MAVVCGSRGQRVASSEVDLMHGGQVVSYGAARCASGASGKGQV